jgi:hypothetical protein
MSFNPNDDKLEQFKIQRHQQCISHIQFNIPGGLPPAPAVADLNGYLAPLLATVTLQVDAQEVKTTFLALTWNTSEVAPCPLLP